MPYVVLEGVDGTGKTTLAKALVEWFNNHGQQAVFLSEPSHIDEGATLRAAWSSGTQLGWEVELDLFMSDREKISHTVRAALQEGIILVSDRSFLSSVVYQGTAARRATGKDVTNKILADHFPIVPWPDAVLWLDVPEDELIKRLDRRGDANTREQDRENQRLFAACYAELAQRFDFARLDAVLPAEQLLQEAVACLAEKGIGVAHNFSGWPGAYCLRCGESDSLETDLANNKLFGYCTACRGSSQCLICKGTGVVMRSKRTCCKI